MGTPDDVNARPSFVQDIDELIRSYKKGCRTCTRGRHEGRCPGLDMKCFACRLHGHMKGSRACKKEKPKAPTKGKKEKE